MELPRPELPSGPPRTLRAIDPNLPADDRDAPFGFRVALDEARIVVVPVPYEATVSSRGGAADGPAALIAASGQVDLADPLAGEPWKFGIAALPVPGALRRLSEATKKIAAEARRGGRSSAAAAVDAAGEAVHAWLADITARLLESGRAPLILGGEHGVSLGAIREAAARNPGLGVLQLDAHADLRAAYEGFRTSHASVMRRVLELPAVGRLVQVALRDFCPEEIEAREKAGGKSVWFQDAALAERLFSGESFADLADEIVAALPGAVWISVDVDGLDPSLCPRTGTPVPGGLGWREASFLLARLGRSGKRVVGADLVECGGDFWDGFVGAKLLYLLAGLVGGSFQP